MDRLKQQARAIKTPHFYHCSSNEIICAVKLLPGEEDGCTYGNSALDITDDIPHYRSDNYLVANLIIKTDPTHNGSDPELHALLQNCSLLYCLVEGVDGCSMNVNQARNPVILYFESNTTDEKGLGQSIYVL